MDGSSDGCSPTNTETLQKLAMQFHPAGWDTPKIQRSIFLLPGFQSSAKFTSPPGSLLRMSQLPSTPTPTSNSSTPKKGGRAQREMFQTGLTSSSRFAFPFLLSSPLSATQTSQEIHSLLPRDSIRIGSVEEDNMVLRSVLPHLVDFPLLCAH